MTAYDTPAQRASDDGLEVAAFLTEAARLLAGSLNLRRTLTRLVQLAVPVLGDWVSVVLPEDATMRVVSLDRRSNVLRDTTMPAWALDASAQGAAQALWSGQAEVIADIAPAALATVVADPAECQRLGAEAQSVMVVPLIARGTTVGVLVAIRLRGATPYSDTELTLAHSLADNAALALDNARRYAERSRIATVLQTQLLPAALPKVTGARIAANFRAAQESSEIGGDFYDVHTKKDGSWTVAVGDVCGKGVEAAVLTGQARQALRTAALVHEQPSAVLDLLNRSLLEHGGDRFATVFYGRGTATDGGLQLAFASAGHPPPLVLRSDGRIEVLHSEGIVVGVFDETFYEDTTIDLARGDVCLLYTDGVTEARVDRAEFGTERLIRLLESCHGLDADGVVARIEQSVLEYLDGGAHDDIALLAIEAV